MSQFLGSVEYGETSEGLTSPDGFGGPTHILECFVFYKVGPYQL